jgi:hypothetical protein
MSPRSAQRPELCAGLQLSSSALLRRCIERDHAFANRGIRLAFSLAMIALALLLMRSFGPRNHAAPRAIAPRSRRAIARSGSHRFGVANRIAAHAAAGYFVAAGFS